MHPERIREIVEQVKAGEMTVDQAMQALKNLPFEDLGFAVIDHHRQLRSGFPEVIYCEGKTVDQVNTIARRILEQEGDLLATRAVEEMYRSLKDDFPEAAFHPVARIISVKRSRAGPKMRGPLAVVCAGTSDLPVAEEAAVTAEVLGNEVMRIYDVGVAAP